MSDFTPPPPKDLISAFIGEIDNGLDEMDGTIAQLTQMLGAAKARLHGLLCAKSVLESKLEEWEGCDPPLEIPDQLELPLGTSENVVSFPGAKSQQ